MPEWLSRTELLLRKERLEKLQQAHVLVAGLGGVGAYAAEQLCRAGIGRNDDYRWGCGGTDQQEQAIAGFGL